MKLYSLIFFSFIGSNLYAMDDAFEADKKVIQDIAQYGASFPDIITNQQIVLQDSARRLPEQRQDELTKYVISETQKRFEHINPLTIAALLGTHSSGLYINRTCKPDNSGRMRAQQLVITELLDSIHSLPRDKRIEACSHVVNWTSPKCLEGHYLAAHVPDNFLASLHRGLVKTVTTGTPYNLPCNELKTIDGVPIESSLVQSSPIKTSNGTYIFKKNPGHLASACGGYLGYYQISYGDKDRNMCEGPQSVNFEIMWVPANGNSTTLLRYYKSGDGENAQRPYPGTRLFDSYYYSPYLIIASNYWDKDDWNKHDENTWTHHALSLPFIDTSAQNPVLKYPTYDVPYDRVNPSGILAESRKIISVENVAQNKYKIKLLSKLKNQEQLTTQTYELTFE